MTSTNSRPIRRSMTDAVRDHIRDGIAEGRYLPGERLREGAIAEVLKVSRTPIREAMRILESEGLIVMQPWKGITVATLTRKQVSDFYSYRETIEGLAAEMAARVVTDQDIERLDNILVQLENKPEQTGSELGKANESFHQMIFDISGSTFLKQSLAVINTAKILIWKPVHRSHERWDSAQQEHRKLFNALRARDPIAAQKAAKEHVRRAAMTRITAIVSDELGLEDLDG